jgi:outer membrane murein-binding lipoprotein Lpp
MAVGDITVIGLVGEVHVIEDIGVSVPKGVAVTVPAELAVRSKDLYRALSQQFVYQLKKIAGGPALSKETEALRAEVDRLRAQVVSLEARNAELETEAAGLRAKAQAADSASQKLDAILKAVESRPVVVNQTYAAPSEAPSRKAAPVEASEVVDASVPHFIPSQIRPGSIGEQRVSVQEQTSETSGVGAAADKLRTLRKKNQ